ncbi:hypothetical protein IPM65_00025 [Candidatus Roizmanbacteria bacterium]|nr:MAG: hypothetical protein IPM65_00025 [Candidatus Roizmanbacteria bacterium]
MKHKNQTKHANDSSVHRYALNRHHKSALTKYLSSYCKEFFSSKSSLSQENIERVSSYLGRHEFITKKYLSPEFQLFTQLAKNLFPNVRAGKIACIDGRESRVIQDGKVFSRWSISAGIPTLIYRNGKKHLASGRLRAAILSVAKQKGEIFELMKIHTSRSAPLDHGCAALKRLIMQENNGTLPADANLVKTGIKLLQERKAVIRDSFNAVRKELRLPTMKKVTVLGLSDTDTLGLTFMGNDEETPLSTVDIAQRLFPSFGPYIQDLYGKKYSKIGLFKESFVMPESIIPFEDMNYHISSTLMEYKPFIDELQKYIRNSNLNLLTDNQVRAFYYTAARNLANQYLLGFYMNEGHPHHPLATHGEKYGSISFDGIHVGQLDPGHQTLKASPSTEQDALDQAEIQHAVLHANNSEKPHVLFVVTAVPQAVLNDEKAMTGYRGVNYNFLNLILNNTVFSKLVQQKELLPVPVLLNESTREIVEIPNQMV